MVISRVFIQICTLAEVPHDKIGFRHISIIGIYKMRLCHSWNGPVDADCVHLVIIGSCMLQSIPLVKRWTFWCNRCWKHSWILFSRIFLLVMLSCVTWCRRRSYQIFNFSVVQHLDYFQQFWDCYGLLRPTVSVSYQVQDYLKQYFLFWTLEWCFEQLIESYSVTRI